MRHVASQVRPSWPCSGASAAGHPCRLRPTLRYTPSGLTLSPPCFAPASRSGYAVRPLGRVAPLAGEVRRSSARGAPARRSGLYAESVRSVSRFVGCAGGESARAWGLALRAL